MLPPEPPRIILREVPVQNNQKEHPPVQEIKTVSSKSKEHRVSSSRKIPDHFDVGPRFYMNVPADGSEVFEDDEKDVENECWAVIERIGSEDDKFEASELVEYRDHDWYIALAINKEKTPDKANYQHLLYSYRGGIQRIILTPQQTDSIDKTPLVKYKIIGDGLYEVLPIHSSLPQTGLISPKYRYNKGVELRIFGIVNWIDFVLDDDHQTHRTMVWTDAVGPIYLSAADRANIRRKLLLTEMQIFAPLRMCHITVKAEFNFSIPDGSPIQWTISSFQPLIEESEKDPNIGRNLWPARVLRFDDLVVTKKTPNGYWLKSQRLEGHVNVFAGANQIGIIESAGEKYATKGSMMAFVVPCYQNSTFAYFEALIAGPPRVVMIITEGRFLNYCPKTWPPSVRKMRDQYQKEHVLKSEVRSSPICMKQPDYCLKSLRGFSECPF